MTDTNTEVEVIETEPEVQAEVKGFIEHPEILEEDYRVGDLLDFSEIIERFTKKLDSIPDTSIFGLVGEYGSGKSTMLYQIQEKRRANELWINFDAWKYPERQDLWEGFVLDFAHQIGEREKAQGEIDGTDIKNKNLSIAAGAVGMIPGLGSIDKFLDVFKSPPATRVYQLQEILTHLINKQSKNIVIVVEDIDRSGDSGIYFLETLRHFLKNTDLRRRVHVVVPIGNENYREEETSYLKCLDSVVFFRPRDIRLKRFVEATFRKTLFEKNESTNGKIFATGEHKKGQVVSFLELLLTHQDKNMRMLKAILRGANSSYRIQQQDGLEPDWRVTICFETAKHIRQENQPFFQFEEIVRDNVILRNSVIALFLRAMLADTPSIYDPDAEESETKFPTINFDFRCVARKGERGKEFYPSHPFPILNSRKTKVEEFGVCDFYLK